MTPCTPSHLTDDELLAALDRLAHSERSTTAELVTHLAELDARQLHLAAGYSSLFEYCCEALHLSEHETYNRIEAARASRRFPIVLEALANGDVNLTTVRLLAPKFTAENHRELIRAATRRRRHEVESLIATRFPRPDIATSIRKLPPPRTAVLVVESAQSDRPAEPVPVAQVESRPQVAPQPVVHKPRPLSAERFEIRFTASASTRDKLRQAQDLMRHAIPNGDTAAIFDRALTLLIEDAVRRKAGEVAVPATTPRSGAAGSRHIPAHIRRAVWGRDGGCCAFVGQKGRRCSATSYLEFHHVKPYAAGGPSTPENIALRCRAHNAYEADLFFAPMRRAEPPSSA